MSLLHLDLRVCTPFVIEEARTNYPPTLLPTVEDYHDLVTPLTCAIHEQSCRQIKLNNDDGHIGTIIISSENEAHQ